MRARGLVFAVVLAAALLAIAGSADARDSTSELRIDLDESIPNADTFMFNVRLDQSAGDPGHFLIANGSFFHVTGHFPPSTNGTAQQDAAAVLGVVRYNTGLDCRPLETNNLDPCFMTASGMSIKDAWDTRVAAGPVTFEQDPNLWGWRNLTAAIGWEDHRRFETPPGQDQVVYRFFVSIPQAHRLTVDAHIHSPQAIEVDASIAHDGGFLATGEDFEPAASVDTAPASAMVSGQYNLPFQEDGDRLFAAFGPAWNGVTAAGNVAVRHNTAAVSDIGYESPEGDSLSGTAFGAGGFSGILVPGSNQLGVHQFDVDSHAGVGPQDLYLAGFKGPTG